MTLVLSQSDARPMYVQIMERVREKIDVGDWKPGDRLPSIREFAVAIKVSVITVKRAYLELEHAGIIMVVHGKGTFVAEPPTGIVAKEGLSGLFDEAVRKALQAGFSEDELEAELKRAIERGKETVS